MLNWHQYEIALEQQADARQRAERERLIRLVAASQAAAKEPWACRVLAALGRTLVAVGTSLQSRAASLEVALRRAQTVPHHQGDMAP